MSVIFSRTFRDGEFTAGADSVESVLTGTDPSGIGSLGLVDGVFAVTIDTYGPVEDGLEEDIDQIEDMKRISGWAAILFAPTLVGAIYGMNFHNMPELSWHFGYPLALALMLVLTVGLFTVFKLKKWF